MPAWTPDDRVLGHAKPFEIPAQLSDHVSVHSTFGHWSWRQLHPVSVGAWPPAPRSVRVIEPSTGLEAPVADQSGRDTPVLIAPPLQEPGKP